MMDGFFLVDKPAGITSHEVVVALRRITGIKKIGHTGTLDPIATGLLVLCLGEATKAAAYLLDEPKVYQVEAELGTSTDTQDRTGRVLARHPECTVSHRALRETLAGFLGPGLQVPPAYSAVQVGGERLYRLARAGRTVVVPPRPVFIHDIRLEWPTEDERPVLRYGDRFGFTVKSSRGFYVRTLCHDLGERLGCGAHLTALRRLAAGPFDVAAAFPLTGLTREKVAAGLISIPQGLAHLPAVMLSGRLLDRVRHGNPVELGTDVTAEMVLALDEEGRAVAVLSRRENIWHPKRVFRLDVKLIR